MTFCWKKNGFECWQESLLSQFSPEGGISIEIKSWLDDHGETDKIETEKFVGIIGNTVKKDEIDSRENGVKYFKSPLNYGNGYDYAVVDFSNLITFLANHRSRFFRLFSNGLEAFI